MKSHALELVRPTASHLPGYVAALERDWSPDNVRGPLAAKEELEQIRKDPERFIQRLTDREAANGGVLVERFKEPAQYGGHDALRFRIHL